MGLFVEERVTRRIEEVEEKWKQRSRKVWGGEARLRFTLLRVKLAVFQGEVVMFER